MIVLDSQPFSLVEDIGFKAFVNKFNPTYTIPTRKAPKLMVEKRYDEAKEKAMAEVQDAEYVSLTADMWTSINMDSYLGVTCHYTTKETKLATVVLGVTRFPQSHTAVNIKEAQNVLMESWGISMEKIHCLVTDNAANMLASAQLLRREAVGAALANLNSDVSPLSSSDYEKIIQCLGVLAPFKYATAEMSEEKRVSASKLSPIVLMIQHKVTEKTKLMTQPFSLVEDIGFKAFVNKFNPTYTIPTRKAPKLMVEKRYDEAKEKAMAEVQDAEYVSLTADMWTSINMDSYLGVTCHYTTKETKLATVVLGVTRFPQSHTAVNIKEAQNVLMESWGISMEKIHCLVTDNAANMLASAQLLRVRHIRCFAHSLNLVVKKALDQTPELQDIRPRGPRVLSHCLERATKQRRSCAWFKK
ncbi:hypothetical protein SKAU_G00056590 [Synaphobranchus kaupii]|uniref:Uncharacterized protein n=1 Tax=Synaphobranchus kaupii TaxID=118154 RepID=A0A9Q1G417_SYNKA|nr:hypothetical protein SKAU_G00056590 [Synaphobranchus kaupii]